MTGTTRTRWTSFSARNSAWTGAGTAQDSDRIAGRYRAAIKPALDNIHPNRNVKVEVVGDETLLRRTLSHEMIGHLGFDLWLGHGADAKDKRARWKSDKVRKNFRLRMEKYVLPKIGDTRINQITQKDVLAILVPIWTDKNETARKCRQFMGDIFKWSMAHEYTEFNPAGEAIAGALPAQRQTRNMRAVPWQETPAALETIRGAQ